MLTVWFHIGQETGLYVLYIKYKAERLASTIMIWDFDFHVEYQGEFNVFPKSS